MAKTAEGDPGSMIVEGAFTWGKIKPNTRGDLVAQLMNDSEIFLSVIKGSERPECIWIEFRGALAHIPAIKNNRHPSFPGIDRRVLGFLHAMDQMFIKEAVHQKLRLSDLSFGDQMAHVNLVVGGRASADEDNAMSTIKDWLEPRTKIVGGKNKHPRGWGIGLVNNDNQLRGYPLKSDDLALNMNYTRIVIRPWDQIRELAVNYVAQCCLVGGPNAA